MEFQCQIKDIARNMLTGKMMITLESSQNITETEELQNQELTCRLCKFKKRRTLDANAYFWVLAHKLAAKTEIPVGEIYRSYVREIGDNNTIVCVRDKDLEALMQGWNSNGLGWIAEPFESKTEGCTNVILYSGSSTYDTAQMHRLIDLVVQDCKEQGIETMAPAELAMLIGGWK